VRHSNSKNLPYYFNAATKESCWEPPSGTDSEKLKLYMAQHHSASAVGADGNGVNEGKIRAAHLLVKHKDSRRPKSWKEVGVTECYVSAERHGFGAAQPVTGLLEKPLSFRHRQTLQGPETML